MPGSELLSFSLEMCLSSAGHGTEDEEDEEEEEEEGRNPVCLDLSSPCTSCADEVKGNSCSSGSGVVISHRWLLLFCESLQLHQPPEMVPREAFWGVRRRGQGFERCVEQTPGHQE